MTSNVCLQDQVASSVLTHSRIIRLKSAGRQEKLDGAVSWFVPNGVNVKQDVGSGKSEGNPSTRRYNGPPIGI